jgi:hypothetical protein
MDPDLAKAALSRIDELVAQVSALNLYVDGLEARMGITKSARPGSSVTDAVNKAIHNPTIDSRSGTWEPSFTGDKP